VFEINRAAVSEGFYPHSRHREYRQLYNRALSSEDRHRADADAPANGKPQHRSCGISPHPIYKEERTLEVWKQDRTGKFALLKSYSICIYSGTLGPKIAQGSRA
jgi:hypothetical protein